MTETKFKTGDRVRSVFDREKTGTITYTFDCPLGSAYHVHWDNDPDTDGELDHQLTLVSWDDFQDKIKDRI